MRHSLAAVAVTAAAALLALPALGAGSPVPKAGGWMITESSFGHGFKVSRDRAKVTKFKYFEAGQCPFIPPQGEASGSARIKRTSDGTTFAGTFTYPGVDGVKVKVRGRFTAPRKAKGTLTIVDADDSPCTFKRKWHAAR